jgi:hypothetical protein
MTLDILKASVGAFWPYLVVAVVGFLPTEIWRVMGVVAAHGVSEESELLVWVRAVSQALVAGVVAKILFFPPGVLATLPAYTRYGAFAAGLTAFFSLRRSVLASLLAGEAALVMLGLASGG